jgi:MFS transporter, FHS family, glucose/mannose:H+ symporter
MATTLLGPLLPLLAARWGLSDAAAGLLFTAQFCGQLTATSLSTILAARIGAPRALALGFGLVAAGVGAIGLVPGSLGWATAVAWGLGLGCVLPLTNVLVAALAPARAASALSLVNVSWGIGAMLWPAIVDAAAGVHPSGATLLLASGAALLSGAWAFGRVPVAPLVTPAGPGGAADHTATASRGLVLLFGTLILLYVGAEVAISGWVAEYARRMSNGAGAWAYAPAAFWGAQTVGRLTTPLLLTRVAERRLLPIGVATGGAAVVLLATRASVDAVVGAAALAGLGLAPVFPLLWAGVSRQIAPGRPGAVGPLFAAGGVGGALLPWLVGAISSAASLRAGLLVPLVALVLMLAGVRRLRIGG